MKYELLWLDPNGVCYSNYAKSDGELARLLTYFLGEKQLKLNDYDRYNNIQVSLKQGRDKWLILTQAEVMDIIAK